LAGRPYSAGQHCIRNCFGSLGAAEDEVAPNQEEWVRARSGRRLTSRQALALSGRAPIPYDTNTGMPAARRQSPKAPARTLGSFASPNRAYFPVGGAPQRVDAQNTLVAQLPGYVTSQHAVLIGVESDRWNGSRRSSYFSRFRIGRYTREIAACSRARRSIVYLRRRSFAARQSSGLPTTRRRGLPSSRYRRTCCARGLAEG